MDLTGLPNVLIFTGIFAGIYALLALGLNLQWGYTGLFNVGVGGFYAIGAYTSALLTSPSSASHVGGWALPIPCGMFGAMLVSGLLAAALGKLTLGLREDYLAIATISLAETLRLGLKNEAWLTNGVQGLRDIPRPFPQVTAAAYDAVYLILVICIVALAYGACQCLGKAPWGRVLRAIREDELVAASVGKNTFHFKLQALIVGAMLMGLGGSLYAHYVKFISPDTFNPLMGTFLVWVMLMAGGSGNHGGAVVGAGLIWGIWSLSDLVTAQLPAPFDTRASYLRVMLISLVLQAILVRRPQGLLPER